MKNLEVNVYKRSPPSSLVGLAVCLRVPVRIEENNSIGPDKINPDAPRLGSEKHPEDTLVVVELVDEDLAGGDVRVAVHPAKIEALLLDEFLDEVEHHTGLAEDEHSMTLLLPQGKDLGEDLEFSGPIDEAAANVGSE